MPSFWEGVLSKQVFDQYIESKGVLHDSGGLFHTIDKHVENVSEYQAELFTLIEKIIDNNNDDDNSMNFRGSSVVKVLQRLYDEAIEEENQDGINSCLDIWDKFLASDIASAISVVRELEKGLLN